MNALIRLSLCLLLGGAPPALTAQQSQRAGFWKAKGSAVHNTNVGRVGIGTTNPTAKLDVAGGVAVNGAHVIDGSGHWVGDPTGLMGPVGPTGSTGPTGPIGPTGPPGVVTFGNGNTRGGTGALANNTSGAWNTAIGVNVLFSNTTGLNNTASGQRALIYNTTGNNNTATGGNALVYNTTGHSNTAAGVQALQFNTTGINNTAMGINALRWSTTGGHNTAAGDRALYLNATGNFNTANGSEALRNSVGASYNTATGSKALYSCTSGDQNTAVGHLSLYANTTGKRNAGFGKGALRSNTAGISNVALGSKALFSNTTGTYNIGIGYRGGYSLTAGSNNIAIGSGGVAGESNTIRIGGGVHHRVFVYGIRGVTTGVADAVPVVIDSVGQLGTISSSRRFKEDIRDMGAATERLLDLRAVLFRYKGREGPDEYGLIAEEVAEVFPELVVYDDEDQPETVKYHLLSTMLLNEMQRERLRNEERAESIEAEIAGLRASNAELAIRLSAIEQPNDCIKTDMSCCRQR
jgi:hypothetical protein